MMKTIYKLALIACALLIALVGCKDDNDNNKKTPGTQSNTGSSVYVMDEKTVTEKLQDIDENGTLTFSTLPIDKMPETEDIICSAPTENAPYGFFYKVKSITNKDGQTTIETSDASLEEAIEDCNISETINLDDHITGIFDENGNPLEYEIETSPANANGQQQAKATNKITIKIGRDIKGPSGTSLGVEGSLSLTNELQFDMNIQSWNLQYLKFAYTAVTDLKTTVSGEIKGKLEERIRIATIKLSPITVPVLGVPVVLVPEIPISLTCGLNGTIKGEFTLFDSKNSITTGILYQNDKVEGIFKQNSSESQSLAERMKVSVSGEIKIAAEVGMAFLLYNSRNVSVNAALGIYGKETLTLLDDNEMEIIEDLAYSRRYALNPSLKVSAGTEASVEGKLRMFRLTLLDYRATKTIFETELFRASVFPQFEDISLSGKTANSAIANTTVQTPSLFNFIVPVSQHGICLSISPLPTVENSDWRNELGELPATWTTVNVPLLSAELKNLQAGTTYYVCPYFINQFGTFYGKVESFTLVMPEIELSSPANGTKLTIGEPVDVSFYVSYLDDATGNSFPFPDCLVHFDTQGKTSQSSAVSGINGLVTVQWTPENDNDRLTAKLVNKDGQIISEAVFTPELDCGGNFTATGGGITINGITWATRNVGAPGTFVASPEDYGEYYQWNKGTTGFLLYDDYYASAYAEGNAWLPENDPCPAGWRVPTDAEFDNLIASTDHSWTSSNGVNGYRFGCGSNSLFLPAAGGRSGSDGSIGYAGSLGYYWSSTPYDSHGAHGLYFSSGYVYTSYFSNRAYGHSVRCVTE